jgi:hypothetical protein
MLNTSSQVRPVALQDNGCPSKMQKFSAQLPSLHLFIFLLPHVASFWLSKDQK